MRRHAPLDSIPADARSAAIALGNFDGVHRGHQAVIASARAHSAHLGVALFRPHPRRFFQPDAPPFRLQTESQRERALAALGVKDLFEIGFNAGLAKRSDEEFARELLHDRLGVSHVSVGVDYRFGRGRMGDAARLRSLGERYGFSVEAVEAVKGGGARYSSTAVRAALAAGDMSKAASILSRPWAIEGMVQRGFQRGRGFGFATANVPLGEYARPRLGIYAVRVIMDGASLPGVASVGVNPTVGALPAPLLEAHVFDFDAELYGKTIEVEMITFLRDEAHFADIEALKTQMADDAAKARAIFA
ncbi:MAG: bifunctional riboflavin kinase/FAD synthetase [Hyphomonadaceae bacterium JAD_PAG50586_4]|nr:MAG: bifunctional riboflavin kinase/FAD synthetase [Hyphomonadaceae bacterium JAD_PAG50586_4]